MEIMSYAIIGIFGIALAALVALAVKVQDRLADWMVKRTTAEQRVILEKIAAEAVAFAGSTMKSEGNVAKLRTAQNYVNKVMGDHGINIHYDQIRGLIEKAYLDYKKLKTRQVIVLEPEPIPDPSPTGSNSIAEFDAKMKATKESMVPPPIKP